MAFVSPLGVGLNSTTTTNSAVENLSSNGACTFSLGTSRARTSGARLRFYACAKQSDEGRPEVVQGTALPQPAAGVTDVNLSGSDLDMLRAGYDANGDGILAALKAGADPNAADVSRRTALHFAAAHGLRATCEELASAGAGLDAQDLSGYTALHMAATYERVDTVKALLAAGADANKAAFDAQGTLPVEIAEKLVEQASAKKMFGFNIAGEQLRRRQELETILDNATEQDDDDDEEEMAVDEEAELERKAKALQDDSSTVVIRRVSKKAAQEEIKEATETKAEAGVDSTPSPTPAAPTSTVPPTPAPASDAKVTIRVRGETLER